jgi:putative nucleotidyltransferase with HDIG domain
VAFKSMSGAADTQAGQFGTDRMHRTTIAQLQPGMTLGKTLYTDKGDVLLARGAVLTPVFIRALETRGYQQVYVMDGIADDVEPLGLVSERLRLAAVRNVQSVYALAEHATRSVRDQAARDGAHVIRDTHLNTDSAMEREISGLVELAEALLEEVIEQDTLSGMAALKAHDNYTFEHSVEVAVYGVMLGQRLGLSRSLLKDVALGCLLHDIGKMYVDARVLNKPGKLDRAEFEQIMQHPLLGFQLVRRMPIPSPRPAHIVLQHHERQDGNGYPNKLFGTNRLARTDQERFDPRRINLLAEIAAIADVYSALASDRPYRAALPVDQIFKMMREEAGQHLNTDLLRTFVSFVQHFPIGCQVRVRGGVHDGALGVVVKVASTTPSRPTVRLLFDRTGRRLGEGDELDLRLEPSHVELEVIPDLGRPLDSIAGQSAPLARAS